MTGSPNRIERPLQLAGILLILGLLTEAASLFWARPLSFLTFITFGGAFLFLGVLVYLLSLLATRPSSQADVHRLLQVFGRNDLWRVRGQNSRRCP